MDTVALKPTVQALQKTVIDLLEQVGLLMQRADETLGSDKADGQYKQFKQEIITEADKVKNLELRMAIVAPMSAGKSTIINSIIGHEILPSRASAMTTLPTEIIFDAECPEPLLRLSPQILSVFQETLLVLRRKLQEEDPAWLDQQMARHPHLDDLLQEIKDMVGFPIQNQVLGHDEVVRTLIWLNDVIRLCCLISPLSDPLRSLTDIPRIRTPFWRSHGSTQSESLGNLVIVDTPGPNEAGENLRLAQEVKQQLQKSSIVLVVLDFTQLNTKAAEEIKQAVQSVIEVRGVENLYVLVNKIDQRREGDPMTSERIQQFIESDLGLREAGYTNHIFEIAARRAFSASSFMQELEQNLEATPQAMQTAHSLAQEVFGIDWEEELEDATAEDLKRKAERLWQKSGFAPFLEKAISALMAEAAPRCMEAALILSGDRLKRLRNDVILRSTAMNADEKKLRVEVGALEESLRELADCRQTLQQVDTTTARLQQELNLILEDLKSKARVDLEFFFSEAEYQRSDVLEKVKSIFEKFFDSVQQKQHKSKGEIEFKSHTEANNFANLAREHLKQKIEIPLENAREKIESGIEKGRSNLMESLKRETQPIIEQANQRLNKTFDINLTLPNPQLQASVDFTKPRVKTNTRLVDQGYEETTTQKRSFWHWCWIIPYEEKTQVKRPDRQEEYYVISLQEIINQFNDHLEQGINSMRKGVDKYLGEDVKQQTETFFENLNQYLTSYQNSLKKAQQDQRLSLGKKGELREKLEALCTESTTALKEVETNRGRLPSLKKDS